MSVRNFWIVLIAIVAIVGVVRFLSPTVRVPFATSTAAHAGQAHEGNTPAATDR